MKIHVELSGGSPATAINFLYEIIWATIIWSRRLKLNGFICHCFEGFAHVAKSK